MSVLPPGSYRDRSLHSRSRAAKILPALIMATSIGAATVASTATASTDTKTSSGKSIYWGVTASSQSEIMDHEAALGRPLGAVRVYKSWDSTLFGPDQKWARDTNHRLFLSIRSMRSDGAVVKYSDIAAAAAGSTLYQEIQSQAAQIREFGTTVYLTFNHEPDAELAQSMGTPSQFKSAWRRLVSIYRAEGVTNARYTFITTAWGFERTDSRNVSHYYPGDTYVNAVGADAYNWYNCRSAKGRWRSLAEVLAAHRAFGLKHPAEELIVGEFSSIEDPKDAGRKADWFRSAAALFKTADWSQYSAVLQWSGRLNSAAGCAFDYTTSASSTAAFAAMGSDASYARTG
jgi:hypothetical protein